MDFKNCIETIESFRWELQELKDYLKKSRYESIGPGDIPKRSGEGEGSTETDVGYICFHEGKGRFMGRDKCQNKDHTQLKVKVLERWSPKVKGDA